MYLSKLFTPENYSFLMRNTDLSHGLKMQKFKTKTAAFKHLGRMGWESEQRRDNNTLDYSAIMVFTSSQQIQYVVECTRLNHMFADYKIIQTTNLLTGEVNKDRRYVNKTDLRAYKFKESYITVGGSQQDVPYFRNGLQNKRLRIKELTSTKISSKIQDYYQTNGMRFENIITSLITARRNELKEIFKEEIDNQNFSLKPSVFYSYSDMTFTDLVENINDCTKIIQWSTDNISDIIGHRYSISKEVAYDLFIKKITNNIGYSIIQKRTELTQHSIDISVYRNDMRVYLKTALDKGTDPYKLRKDVRNRFLNYFKNYLGTGKNTFVTDRSASFKFIIKGSF